MSATTVMAMSEQQAASAHSAALKAITDARQNTRNYRFLMEKSDRVQDDAIFVAPGEEKHPQKLAHAALIDFQQELAQPEYTVMMDDVWRETLTDETGDEIQIDVPKQDTIKKAIGSRDDPENVLPERDSIETKTETLSLETLPYKWSGRTITVRIEWDSPYYSDTDRTRTVRLWLPPKAIKAAYSQLNSALSKIGLLANTSAPIERDPDPI